MIDWNGIKIVETDCMLPVDRVKPYARNAKRHPQEQIDEIKASIKRFGMDDPIGIWGKENLIVEGTVGWKRASSSASQQCRASASTT